MPAHPPEGRPPASPPISRQGWKFDEDAQERFFRNYLETGLIHVSCRAAGVSEECFRQYRLNNYNGFADRFREIDGLFRDSIEAEIRRRAIQGIDEPIIGGKDRDEVVITVKRYSDKLLEMYAKRHIPEYRERQQLDVNVSGGVVVVPSGTGTVEDWDKEFGALERPVINGLEPPRSREADDVEPQ